MDHPGIRRKDGDAIKLTLVPEALEIVKSRKHVQGSGYVFRSEGDVGRLSSTWERWDAIRKAANVPDLTQHDLRRTLITLEAEAGVNPAVAAKAAGHRPMVAAVKVYVVVRQHQMLAS